MLPRVKERMGIHDRDWYREAIRDRLRREEQDARRGSIRSSTGAGSSLRFVLTWIVVGLVVFAVVRWLDKDRRQPVKPKSSQAQLIAPGADRRH